MIENKKDINHESISQVLDIKILKPAEELVLLDFFCELGKHGVTQEKQKIENKKIVFDTFLQNATIQLKRDASMYFKLFIFMGIGGAILLI